MSALEVQITEESVTIRLGHEAASSQIEHLAKVSIPEVRVCRWNPNL